MDFSFSTDGLAFIDDAQANALNNVTIESKDVLLNITGDSVARVCQVPDKWIPARVNQHVAIIRTNQDILCPEFLLYSLLTKGNKNTLLTLASAGATRNALTKTMIEDFEITIPPLPEQIAIASILSAIDDKIENNLGMNKTLEEMAMTLYKQWFVDFGPFRDGEFVDSELGKIPKGWEIIEFRDILNLIRDGSHNPPPRTEKGVKFIAGATDIRKLEVSFNKCTYISKNDYDKIHRFWELKTGDVLMTIVGTIGNTAIVQKDDLPFSLQRSIAVFRAIDEVPNYFIYMLINSDNFKNFVIGHTNPTGQPGIYLKTLGNYKLGIPSYKLLKHFGENLSPLFDKMFSNLAENQTLTNLRDTLTPKLISGEVRVKDLA